MRYNHSFVVDAPLTVVADFHRQSASMGAITPPPVIVKVHSAPTVLQEGDTMDFTMWLGPLPIRWFARISDTSPTGFVDSQIRGPFTKWEHRHSFVALDSGRTEVRDEINAELGNNPFWKLVGMGMWLNMPVLFAFRGWQTRRLLRQRAGQTADV